MLTRDEIQAAQPDPDMDSKSWRWMSDGLVDGLGVKVYGSGHKVFALRYRTAQGKHRMITYGDVDSLSIEDVRGLARQHKAGVAGGQDPAARLRGESVTVYYAGSGEGAETKLFLRIKGHAKRKQIMRAVEDALDNIRTTGEANA